MAGPLVQRLTSHHNDYRDCLIIKLENHLPVICGSTFIICIMLNAFVYRIGLPLSDLYGHLKRTESNRNTSCYVILQIRYVILLIWYAILLIKSVILPISDTHNSWVWLDSVRIAPVVCLKGVSVLVIPLSFKYVNETFSL